MTCSPVFLSIELSATNGQIEVSSNPTINGPLSIPYGQKLVLEVSATLPCLTQASILLIQFFSIAGNAPSALHAVWAKLEGNMEGDLMSDNTFLITIEEPADPPTIDINNFNNSMADQPVFIICSGLVNKDGGNVAWHFDPEIILRSGQG